MKWTAGGAAGMMEALVCHPLGRLHQYSGRMKRRHSFDLLTWNSRHNQSTNAIVAASKTQRCTETNLPLHRSRYHKTRNTLGTIQRFGGCDGWHSTKNGNSIYKFWGIQKVIGRQRDWRGDFESNILGWSFCWCDWSSGSGDTNGSDQDSITRSIP